MESILCTQIKHNTPTIMELFLIQFLKIGMSLQMLWLVNIQYKTIMENISIMCINVMLITTTANYVASVEFHNITLL